MPTELAAILDASTEAQKHYRAELAALRSQRDKLLEACKMLAWLLESVPLQSMTDAEISIIKDHLSRATELIAEVQQ